MSSLRRFVGLASILFVISGCATPSTPPSTVRLAAQPPVKCKVNDPDIGITYSGGCKDGLAHDKGVAAGRDRYEGEFFMGDPHGKGTYLWGDNSIWAGHGYQGEFAYGNREGHGIYYDGVSLYEGRSVNNIITGMCKRTTPLSRYTSEAGGEWIGKNYITVGWCERMRIVVSCESQSECEAKLKLLDVSTCLQVKGISDSQEQFAKKLSSDDQFLEQAAKTYLGYFSSWTPKISVIQQVMGTYLREAFNDLGALTRTHQEFYDSQVGPETGIEGLIPLPSLWVRYCETEVIPVLDKN